MVKVTLTLINALNLIDTEKTLAELLEIQNAIKDEDVKLLLEHSISTTSSSNNEKS